jgi:hypothetical protein
MNSNRTVNPVKRTNFGAVEKSGRKSKDESPYQEVDNCIVKNGIEKGVAATNTLS